MIDGKAAAAADLDPPLPWLKNILGSPAVSSFKNRIGGFFEWFGELGMFFWQVLRAAVTPPFEFREVLRQLDEIGSKSLPVVALAGGAIGVILSLEARHSLTRFGAKSMLPAAIVFAVIDESGPIITGLVASGRLGAGIGAELASMKVTEQIDAIEASAVNPYRLLAAPRILACILMLPLLTLAADFCGLVMGWVTQTLVEPISFYRFIDAGFRGATFNDLLPPTFKTAVFGLLIFDKRKKMKVTLDILIPEFSVRMGGATSIDITKPAWMCSSPCATRSAERTSVNCMRRWSGSFCI